MEQNSGIKSTNNKDIQDPITAEKIELLIQKTHNITIPSIIFEYLSNENIDFEINDLKVFYSQFGEVVDFAIKGKLSIALFKTFFSANVCREFLLNENNFKKNMKKNFDVRWFNYEKDMSNLPSEMEKLFEEIHNKNLLNLKINNLLNTNKINITNISNSGSSGNASPVAAMNNINNGFTNHITNGINNNNNITNGINNNNITNGINNNITNGINNNITNGINNNITNGINNNITNTNTQNHINNINTNNYISLNMMMQYNQLNMNPNMNINNINQNMNQMNNYNRMAANIMMSPSTMNMQNMPPQIFMNQNMNVNNMNNIMNMQINNNHQFNQNKNFNQTNEEKNYGKYTCKYEILIPNDKEFQVARRLIGSKGCNMKKILNECKSGNGGNSNDNVKLRLRGKGSGYKEGPQNKESNEQLHLCISAKNQEEMKKACGLVDDLLNKIFDEYKKFCVKNNITPVATQLANRIDCGNSLHKIK